MPKITSEQIQAIANILQGSDFIIIRTGKNNDFMIADSNVFEIRTALRNTLEVLENKPKELKIEKIYCKVEK